MRTLTANLLVSLNHNYAYGAYISDFDHLNLWVGFLIGTDLSFLFNELLALLKITLLLRFDANNVLLELNNVSIVSTG